MSLLSIESFKDIKVFDRKIHKSDIGFFLNTFQIENINLPFVQDSISHSLNTGTIRGMHFQRPPFAQAKIINVLQGEIIDFFVDLRVDSDTFLSHGKLRLCLDDPKSLYIPRGFAHGFITLQPNTIVAYKLDNEYCANNEQTLLWNDKEINIQWPEMKKYYHSKKDINGLPLKKILQQL